MASCALITLVSFDGAVSDHGNEAWKTMRHKVKSEDSCDEWIWMQATNKLIQAEL